MKIFGVTLKQKACLDSRRVHPPQGTNGDRSRRTHASWIKTIHLVRSFVRCLRSLINAQDDTEATLPALVCIDEFSSSTYSGDLAVPRWDDHPDCSPRLPPSSKSISSTREILPRGSIMPFRTVDRTEAANV